MWRVGHEWRGLCRVAEVEKESAVVDVAVGVVQSSGFGVEKLGRGIESSWMDEGRWRRAGDEFGCPESGMASECGTGVEDEFDVFELGCRKLKSRYWLM